MLLTILILAFLSTARARPSLHRRGLPGAVYTCTDTNFRGDCQWTAPTTQCRQPGPASLGFSIQSLGPDPVRYISPKRLVHFITHDRARHARCSCNSTVRVKYRLYSFLVSLLAYLNFKPSNACQLVLLVTKIRPPVRVQPHRPKHPVYRQTHVWQGV